MRYWGLCKYCARKATLATLVGGVGMAMYTLVHAEALTWRDANPALLAALQSLMLAWVFGRFGSREFAFLYTRGYRRDVLWACVMLTSVLSAAVPIALSQAIVWSGLRNFVHQNDPMFPYVGLRETWVPLEWSLYYVVLLPGVHYAWIRMAQPFRGQRMGILFAGAMGFGAFYADGLAPHGWRGWLLMAAGTVVVGALLIAGRCLHRELEVRT